MSPFGDQSDSTRIGAVMSYGVKTVQASALLRDIIRELRLIGHEGYPVLDGEKLVGLLSRRDADRAVEHGLDTLPVRDVMQSGSISLRPDAPIEQLEQRIIESGWGQIPVTNANGSIIGIVTRTDLIKYWARVRGASTTSASRIDQNQIGQVLGKNIARLVNGIAEVAQAQGAAVYLVGGCVRDLLLKRRNLDIDFVVEGDGIAFARELQKQYDGALNTFAPFGTAKWMPNANTIKQLGVTELPAHIDFATARNEFYLHPTALPTVYSGSIKLDLQRRDFTINTLAIQVSPDYGQILDFYGGLRDLETGQIRVLHSLSFIDDPTRILRAARFEHRLGFRIEPRTNELITPALPMLRRITGERLRNELDLLLQEIQSEKALLRLDRRGVLAAIHPALRFDERLVSTFAKAREQAADNAAITFPDIYWHLLAATLSPADVETVCERLLFPRSLQEGMVQTAKLQGDLERLAISDLRPSQITPILDGYMSMTLWATIITTNNTRVQSRLREYLQTYQHIKAQTTGDDLKARGLKPSPCFKRILDRLRAARLDGEVNEADGEKALVDNLIAGGICDDDV